MSWEQLAAIEQQQRDDAVFYASQPPVACPNDGTPLEMNSGGVLGCPFDGWLWDGMPVVY